jgi:hypothetical protein
MAKQRTAEDDRNLLQEALTDLANLSPNRAQYDKFTTVLFQLFAGNEMGLTYGMHELLARIEKTWKTSRKSKKAKLGLRIVK